MGKTGWICELHVCTAKQSVHFLIREQAAHAVEEFLAGAFGWGVVDGDRHGWNSLRAVSFPISLHDTFPA